MEPGYTRTGHKTTMEMFDVRQQKKLTVEVELVQLANKRWAVTGENPETHMQMFKLIKKTLAQEIMGEVVI